MKFIPTLILTIILTVTVGVLLKIPKKHLNQSLVSPLVAGINTTNEMETPNDANIVRISWPIFVNNYAHYKIRHPSEVVINNRKNGDISLVKDPSVNIFISQNHLGQNNTINTIIENDIDNKKVAISKGYVLEGIITPIALGSVTAYTYTASENGTRVSYYYIPQNDGLYLLITNRSPHSTSEDYLTSEEIIYSLELIP